MRFSHLHKVVAYLLSGLGFFALSLGNELSEPVLVVVILGYFASYFVDGKILASKTYSRNWTIAVVVFLLVQVLRGFSEATLSLALEFAAALQISRLFNRRSAQDYQQIAVLAFLHLIAATVLSTEIAYALVFVGFVIVTPWMLALSHLRREIEANYPSTSEGPGGAEQAGLSRVLASKRVVGPRYLAGTALLSLPLFLMTLVIFLAVPRVGQGFLNFGRKQGDKVAGFGNQVELGGFGVIRDDPSVVLRVTPMPKLDDRARRLQLRLRGTSFDHYDGRLWSRSREGRHPIPVTHAGTYVLQRAPRTSDQRLRIVLDQLDQPVVFLPEGTVALRIDPKIVRARSINRKLTIAMGHDLRYPDDDGVGLIYDAFVTPERRDTGIKPMIPEELGDYLQVPAEHERVAQLAMEVAKDAQTPLQKAEAVRRYLQSDVFTYSLSQPSVGPSKQPLDVFLFEAKRGHCEYFSTAMAIMLRTLGIPTRNVTGFLGGRYNSYGEYYALRQGDAHSWVEVKLGERGWVTFDPTPTAAAELSRRDGLWSDLHAIADAVRVRWMTTVVGYDMRAQIGILRSMGHWFSGGGGGRAGDNLGDGRNIKAKAKGAAVLVIALGAVVALAFFVLGRLRRRSATVSHAEYVEQALALYRQLERALQRAGKPRPTERTPVEHAELLRQEGFSDASTVIRVTDAYMAARYGELPLRASELAQLQRAVAELGTRPGQR